MQKCMYIVDNAENLIHFEENKSRCGGEQEEENLLPDDIISVDEELPDTSHDTVTVPVSSTDADVLPEEEVLREAVEHEFDVSSTDTEVVLLEDEEHAVINSETGGDKSEDDGDKTREYTLTDEIWNVDRAEERAEDTDSSEEDEPRFCRRERSRRIRKPPKIFTYDEKGNPSFQ